MAAKGKLAEYNTKRDFKRTPEPRGATAKPRKARSPRFVVHEHHARRLHWDLRLEHDGALMSWAVPNGIPRDPEHNRKAIHVEDHPLSYIDFEGEIPAGSYGAGQVLIWDRGTYDFEKLEEGKLVVVFHGERLRGRYALFQTRGKDWMIHRIDPPERESEPMPEHLTPMLARASSLPADDQGWAYEIKWDGIRALLYSQPGRVRIETRNLNDVSSRYPELRELGAELGSREAILDGEIVAFDHGRPSFAALQKRMHLSSQSAIRKLARESPVHYVIFDLLYLEGHSTMSLSYRERRELLEQLGLNGAHWQTPAYHEGQGAELLAAVEEQQLEGVVAKRLDSPYGPGERNGQWLKIKTHNRQELVIGGWLEGQGNRAGRLGALLMGYYEQPDKNSRAVLRYAGRVGTGFDEEELDRLTTQLRSLARKQSPFSGTQPPRTAHFVRPSLVAEIEFAQWTRDRILRHSSYKGLREDKPALDVRLEVAEKRESGEEPKPNDAPYEVLHQTARTSEIVVEGRTLKLSNRGKVLYPQSGFTKGELVDYYAAVAPVLLPHLAARPVTFKRYPDGVEGKFFYEKRCPPHRPEWVRTAAISSERKGTIDYCLIEDLPTLTWAANLASIELHPSLSRAPDIERPTAMVFDLDPGAPAGLRECCRVALAISELLGELGLQTVVKTSGSKGLQVYAPLNTKVSYEQTKPFAHAVAQLLETRHPKRVTSRMGKDLRAGKVLIDWSQNDRHKTTVSVYSLRAQEQPTISTPLRWEEIELGLRSRGELQLSAEPAELLRRVAEHGDIFAPLSTLTQALPDLSAPEDDIRFEMAPERGSPIAANSRSGKGGSSVPPRGVKKNSKRGRQYEHVKESEKKQGASEKRAEEIAARTVNKERARGGESHSRSRASTQDISSGRRGGLRSGKPGPRGRTREQLYEEARKLGVQGRSSMNKEELKRAVDARK
jgi:bifunctional non-homologous end joining protein LigD